MAFLACLLTTIVVVVLAALDEETLAKNLTFSPRRLAPFELHSTGLSEVASFPRSTKSHLQARR